MFECSNSKLLFLMRYLKRNRTITIGQVMGVQKQDCLHILDAFIWFLTGMLFCVAVLSVVFCFYLLAFVLMALSRQLVFFLCSFITF